MSATGTHAVTLSEEIEAVRADAELVDAELAASGDAHAFERLYRSHVARIHSLARRMINVDHADEATQDVFVRAWQKINSFRGESAFGTWLHRLAINVILGRRSSLGVERGRFDDQEGLLDDVTAGPVSPDLAMDFETAIAKLPPGAKKIFVLHDVEGFKHEEIAESLGIAAGTSKAQLHRARMLLRRHLTR
ncbi:MAG: RNA polymerase sigma factor [Gemmatimonadetes bacterium]|nr:RNA polymerase sigma factor [Gemmatimonadota bacterium]